MASRDHAPNTSAATPKGAAPECCERCRFSHPSSNYIIREARGQLECRFNPPIMVKRQSSCAEWYESGWPEVDRWSACGRFSALADAPVEASPRQVKQQPRDTK